MSVLDRSKAAQEKYWAERAERVILEAEKTQEEMTAGLAKAYIDAQKAIQKEIEAFYGKYARDVGVSLEDARKALNKSELKSYREQTQEYYDAIKATGYAFDPAYRQKLHRRLSLKSAVSRLDALQSDIQFQVEKLYAQEQDAFREGMGTTYEDAYYRTIFNIQQGKGFGSAFTALNAGAIEKAVSQKWLGENYSDRIWTDKDRLTIAMEQIIPRGIALGQNPRIIGKDIAHQMGVRQSYGERLARTEFNYIANQASKAAYKEAGVMQYKILATLDLRTSDICRDMDGKLFSVGEEQPGVNFPPFHPHCRTTTIPYFEPDEIDALDDKAQRIARDPETGRNYYVPADMTHKEWRDGLVNAQGEEALKKSDEKDTINYKQLDDPAEYDKLAERQDISAEESYQIWRRDDGKLGYIQAWDNYRNINGYLRGDIKTITPDNQKTVDILDAVTKRNALPDDLIGTRRADTTFIKNVFGIDTGDFLEGFDYLDETSAERAVEAISALIGKSFEDKAFMSISLIEERNAFSKRPVKITLQMPAGTKGLIANNKDESEFISAKGSKIEIQGAEIFHPSSGYRDDEKFYINIFAKLMN